MNLVINEIKKGIKATDMRVPFDEDVWDDLLDHMRVRIAVPHVWGPRARRDMQRAVKAAGVQVAVVAEEPRCALAYLVNSWANGASIGRQQLQQGNSIIIVDGGSGTTDVGVFELLEDLSESSRLERKGYAYGEVGGAYQLDLSLCKKLFARMGDEWRITSAQKLGVTERDFERRALIAIEKVKKDLKPYSDLYAGPIQGSGGTGVLFHLTKEEITSSLDEVMATNFRTIDNLISRRRPELMVLTGGLFKSWYSMEKFRERYEDGNTQVVRPHVLDNADVYPVAVGGLCRYENITTQNLPSQGIYGMTLREQFDPSRHTDAFIGNPKDRNYAPWNLPSPYNKHVRVVDDRIRIIVPKNAVLEEGESKALDLLFFIPVHDPQISAEFIYMTKEFSDGEPARDHAAEPSATGYDENNADQRRFRDGVQRWTFVKFPLTRHHEALKKHLKAIPRPEGRSYRAGARFKVSKRGEDMVISVEIRYVNADGNPMNADGKFTGRKVCEVREPLWEASHSEFAEQ